MAETIGQIIGVLGALCSFASYQLRTKRKILIAQMLTMILLAVNYLLLGGLSGAVLNAVCALRCLIYYHSDKKLLHSKAIPYALTVVIVGLGALSWQNAFSLFVIAALATNNLVLASGSAQALRKSLLITCPMMLIYSISICSIGGIITELLTITSAILGILRYRKKEKDE